MGIFDKILGKSSSAKATADKEEEKEKPEKVKAEKSARGGSTSTMEVEPPKKAKSKKEVAKRKVSKRDENIAHKILLENMISEKSTLLASQNKFIFKVVKEAGKFQIKEAIEGYYGVQVVSVNTITINPKKRIHGRTIGWKKGFKKAVVTLRGGDTIGAVEGV